MEHFFQAIDFIAFVDVGNRYFDPAPRTGMRYVHAAHQSETFTATMGAGTSLNSAAYTHRTPVLSQRLSGVPCASSSRRAGFESRMKEIFKLLILKHSLTRRAVASIRRREPVYGTRIRHAKRTCLPLRWAQARALKVPDTRTAHRFSPSEPLLLSRPRPGAPGWELSWNNGQAQTAALVGAGWRGAELAAQAAGAVRRGCR